MSYVFIASNPSYFVFRYGFITFKACSVGAVRKLLHDTDATELTVRGGRTLTVGPARQRKYQPGHQVRSLKFGLCHV